MPDEENIKKTIKNHHYLTLTAESQDLTLVIDTARNFQQNEMSCRLTD